MYTYLYMMNYLLICRQPSMRRENCGKPPRWKTRRPRPSLRGGRGSKTIKTLTKTIISRQIYSARSSRLPCSKLPMRAHRMQLSTGPFSP